MKQLQKSELIDGEIYICVILTMNIKYLIKKTSDLICNNLEILPLKNELFFAGGFNRENNQFFEATPEEKHWLETCIKENKFISYEEAMKDFIPEYVECLENNINQYTKGKIYKNNLLKSGIDHYDQDFCDNNRPNGWSSKYFKQSTKEAYDAQFVVKEPEFVLPEKWCILRTRDNFKIINKWCNKNKLKGDLYNYSDNNRIVYSEEPSFSWNNYKRFSFGLDQTFTEITFEQFKQYVLKEEPKVTEVLEEPKDKVLTTLQGKILEVESSEGGVFQIGDKITPFDKDSPNKGKSFTITGFRWNNAKTEICAITELHKPYGIRLSQIELYVEPKKELSFLEEVKLRYPIGTKFKNAWNGSCNINYIHTVQSYDNIPNFKDSVHSGNAWIVYLGKWAEIIEEVDDFVLPEKWCVKNTNSLISEYFNSKLIYNSHCYSADSHKGRYLHSIDNRNNNVINSKINASISYMEIVEDFTEITLEQFKKYILKDE